MKVILVGCGGISETWLKAASSLPVTLVGLVDLDIALAQQRAEQFDLDVPVSADLSDLLTRTRPDVVFDCTAPQAHFEVTLKALEAGCHVFGEKPMADSLAQAREMVQAAQAAGKVYAVMQNRRYDPNLRRLQAVLASGVLGTVTTVNADFYIGARFGGFRESMPHVLVKDMAIHTFDTAWLLTGDPRAVYCLEWNPAGSWYDQDASAAAIFEMANGVVFTYRGSWCAEGLRTPWESEWRIIGTNGSVKWDGADNFQAEVVADSSGFLSTYTPLDIAGYESADTGEGHFGAIRAFLSALDKGEAPETVCTDNIKSLAMVLSAVTSASARERVPVSW